MIVCNSPKLDSRPNPVKVATLPRMARRRNLRQAFGMRVRLLRVERGWSQEKLAERSGLERTYVGSIERGERNIGLESVDRIAKAFGIPLAELFSELKW